MKLRKYYLIATIVLVAGILLLVGYIIIQSKDQDEHGQEEEITFETVMKNSYSNYTKESKYAVVTTQEDYDQILIDLYGDDERLHPDLPKIDFTEKMVLAVFQGGETTGGHVIEIHNVVEQDDIMHVYVQETSPGENCVTTQATTNPFHIVMMDRTDKEFEFHYEQKVMECEE